MNEIIHGQVMFLLASLVCGMLLIVFYEPLRLLRCIFYHSKTVVCIEDILYWAAASIPVYMMFFYYNDGELRWYGFLMLIAGAYIYNRGISMPVRGVLRRIYSRLIKSWEKKSWKERK